jgi:predicted O-methyltransferase YrrM
MSDRDGCASPERTRQVIERMLRDGTNIARSDGSAHALFPVAIGAAEGEALRERVIRERAFRTIEIGLGYGVSTLFICEALLALGAADARHVVIDPYQTRFAGCGIQAIADAGLESIVEFHAAESQIVLPRMLAEGRRFDLAFVDGNHRFDSVFLDLIYLGQILRPRGALFVDDYQLPAVARAASFCVANLDWAAEESSTTDALHHWVVLRTPAEPRTRSFDHFVDF